MSNNNFIAIHIFTLFLIYNCTVFVIAAKSTVVLNKQNRWFQSAFEIGHLYSLMAHPRYIDVIVHKGFCDQHLS